MSQLLKTLEKLDKKSKEPKVSSQNFGHYYLLKSTKNYLHFFILSLLVGLVFAYSSYWLWPKMNKKLKNYQDEKNILLSKKSLGENKSLLERQRASVKKIDIATSSLKKNEAQNLSKNVEKSDLASSERNDLTRAFGENERQASLIAVEIDNRVEQAISKEPSISNEQSGVIVEPNKLSNGFNNESSTTSNVSINTISSSQDLSDAKESEIFFESPENLLEYEILGLENYQELRDKKEMIQNVQSLSRRQSSASESSQLPGMIHFSTNKEFIKNIEKLRRLKMKHQFRQYERLLDSLQEQYPESLLLMRIAANYALEKGEHYQYISMMRETIEAHQQKEDIIALSKFYLQEHRLVDLIETLSLVDKNCCADQDVLEMFAYAYLETSQWSKATEAYSKLTQFCPHQASYWLGHAKSLEKRKIYDKALQSYHQALNLRPQQSIQKLAIAGVIRLKSYEYTELQKQLP
jgi:hypothetical protein